MVVGSGFAANSGVSIVVSGQIAGTYNGGTVVSEWITVSLSRTRASHPLDEIGLSGGDYRILATVRRRYAEAMDGGRQGTESGHG